MPRVSVLFVSGSTELRHNLAVPKSQRGSSGDGKQALLDAGPSGGLLGWGLGLSPEPQQTQGCVEQVDGRGTIGDEGRF